MKRIIFFSKNKSALYFFLFLWVGIATSFLFRRESWLEPSTESLRSHPVGLIVVGNLALAFLEPVVQFRIELKFEFKKNFLTKIRTIQFSISL